MTMTCHVLHAGDGYTYLTNQVASGDVERSAHEPLAGYYTAAGNPPGQWAGSGVAALGMSGPVTEEHMLALFGEGLHPDANNLITAYIEAGMPFAKAVDQTRLGRRFYQFSEPNIPLVGAVRDACAEFEQTHRRRPSVAERRAIKERVAADLLAGPGGARPAPETVRRYLADELGRARQPVAGFDLVFSPVKSVSVVWALGGHKVRQVVEQVHEAAWKAALAYGEREAGFTRIGKGGVAQIDTHGFVAAAFVHRDSRAGDPDLHTHVVIANRVLGVDGQWRTLDSQQVHRVAVSMSEVYNAALEQGLTDRLGVAWTEVAKGAGKRAVREIDGIPAAWRTGFSRRRSQVEAGYEQLVADYVARYGHTPPRSVQLRLAQQATLTDRPDKKVLKALADQISEWSTAAERMLPGQNITAVVAGALGRAPAVAEPVDVAAVAARVVEVVSAHRATWTVYHVRAEAIRQLKPHPFGSTGEREAATEQVVAAALSTESLELGVQPDPTPRLVQRADGESIYTRHGATRYTSHRILDAETRLLEAATVTAGPVVPGPVARTAIARHEAATGRTLNPGQRQLVEQFVTSGRALAVGIGPPGTGKSTTMAAVRAAWSTTGGRVLGLAPSAAAASVLGDELGVPADTLHSLALAHEHGREVDVRAGDLLLVDEAGMAGTRLLDQVRAIAAERGAVVRLLGDYRQLAAVEAGGALRLLHGDAGGTELTEVHRFTHPAEATAVLRLRVGDPAATGFYAARGRLHGGTRAAVLDELYAAWRADTNAGHAAIMISDSTEVVRELSGRAQTERRAAGRAEPGGVRLHDDTEAGVGDRIVTRYNLRRLAVHGGTDYVKNGDLWDVLDRGADGTLTVRHVRHGGRITLPAGYVAAHVELGYAATIHRSQGLTVEVSRAYLSPLAVREAALVALSRGTAENHAYLDTDTILEHGEPETLPGDLFYSHRNTDPAAAAFTTILRREGAERSATEHLREALDAPSRLDVLVPQYLHALSVYRGPDAAADAAAWVTTALPSRVADIVADPAWPALAATLLELRDGGADPAGLLARRATQRPLEDDPTDPARSVAQVLHHRLAPDLPAATGRPDRPAGLPGWIPAPPAADSDQPREVAELGQWLRDQADTIADRVQRLGEQTAEAPPAWAARLGPVPADPLDCDTWITRAGQVAAYREQFGVPADDPVLLPGDPRGEQARARTWVQHQLHNPATEPVREAEPERPDLAPEDTQQRAAEAYQAEQGEQDRVREQVAGIEREDQRALDRIIDRVRSDPSRELRRADRRQAAEEAWEARPHSHLTDTQLDAAVERHQQRADQARQRHAATAEKLATLQPQVQAGRGPQVQAVDARVTELAVRAAHAAEYDQLAARRQAAIDEQLTAITRAAKREHAAEQLTRRDALRYPGLRDQRIAEAGDLQAQAARAEHTANQAHARMQQLAEQAGGDQQLHRAQAEARAAVEHHNRDRHTATDADQRDLDHLRRQLTRYAGDADKADTTAGELASEKQTRAELSPYARIVENGLRSTWQTEQQQQQQELQAEREAEQQRYLERERHYDSPHLQHGIDRGPGLSL